MRTTDLAARFELAEMLHKTVGEIEGIPEGAPPGMEYREFRYWQIWEWAKATERPNG